MLISNLGGDYKPEVDETVCATLEYMAHNIMTTE